MPEPSLRLVSTLPRAQPQSTVTHGRSQLAVRLLKRGQVTSGHLAQAETLLTRQSASLSETLIARGWSRREDIRAATCAIWGCAETNLENTRPDAHLMQLIPPELCLKHSFVPLRSLPGGLVIALSDPERFAVIKDILSPQFGRMFMTLAAKPDIQKAVRDHHSAILAQRAETRVSETYSCRTWNMTRLRVVSLCVLALLAIGLIISPPMVFALLCGWAVLTMLLNLAVKITAAIAQFNHPQARHAVDMRTDGATTMAHLPKVTIFVPLFQEREIASHLIARLRKLDYPRELLEIFLVVEDDDLTTQTTISQTRLPPWVQVLAVPEGDLRTKPRALNFALNFASGDIVGVYDAEDAPDPDQIHKIVRRFHECGPEVACLQGVLDYYNARTNWLSRCFTIEYATWFRIILPGLVRMGYIIPLGGTTLFFRRQVLESLGAWDAHNVTEDADLGIRLARYGYRTELVPTVTGEEANCRTLPWIRQRSRWLKGYAATWAVHMRNPALLWRQLGAKRFIGFQILFLGTLSQFVLAPLLWSFWLIPLGVAHPMSGLVPSGWIIALGVLFLFAELTTIAIGMLAVSSPKHRFLIPWVPTLHFYFPLGALASYKGIWELFTRPFYWDKTKHGIFEPTTKPRR